VHVVQYDLMVREYATSQQIELDGSSSGLGLAEADITPLDLDDSDGAGDNLMAVADWEDQAEDALMNEVPLSDVGPCVDMGLPTPGELLVSVYALTSPYSTVRLTAVGADTVRCGVHRI